MGARTIFLDGYNAIHATPALAALLYSDLAVAREALLKQVAARYRHETCRIVIVFDGDGASETRQPIAGFTAGQVVFSRREETADSVIVRLAGGVRAAGGDALVISNDTWVRTEATLWGASSERVSAAPAGPRLLRKRFTRQRAAREEMERDSEDTEARAAARKKGNPRKPPRQRNR